MPSDRSPSQKPELDDPTARVADHLTDEQILCYLAGPPSAAELLAAFNHVSNCRVCDSRCKALAKGQVMSDWLGQLVEHNQWLSIHPEHVEYEEMSAYVHGQLSPEDCLKVLVHLRGCSECRDREADLRSFNDEMNAYPPVHFGPDQTILGGEIP